MSLELEILSNIKENKKLVLATVYKKSGSVPRGPGASMIVFEDGTTIGTVGGGRVEVNTIEFAKEFLNDNIQSTFLNYNLAPGKDGENIDMICGGRVTILIEKILPTDKNIKLFEEFDKILKKNIPSVWVYDVSDVKEKGELKRYLVTNDNKQLPQELINEIFLGNEIIKTAGIYEIKNKTYFIHPFMQKGTLILVGAGHVSIEVAELASKVDFDIIVIDDRKEFANKDRFPNASKIIVTDDFENVFHNIEVYNNSYIVILTRAHLYDQTVLHQALQTNAIYIGMIGSKKKRDTIYKNLMQLGVSEKQLKSVYSPIGINIGGETPTEIAISIVAELISVRSK
jgi:xanthine dehydrogenase accessory factor